MFFLLVTVHVLFVVYCFYAFSHPGSQNQGHFILFSCLNNLSDSHSFLCLPFGNLSFFLHFNDTSVPAY